MCRVIGVFFGLIFLDYRCVGSLLDFEAENNLGLCKTGNITLHNTVSPGEAPASSMNVGDVAFDVVVGVGMTRSGYEWLIKHRFWVYIGRAVNVGFVAGIVRDGYEHGYERVIEIPIIESLRSFLSPSLRKLCRGLRTNAKRPRMQSRRKTRR